MRSPAQDGYRVPGEWAPHERCWMGWPCREAAWRGRIEPARDAYAAVARAIAAFEPVVMLARPVDLEDAARRCGPTVTAVAMPLDDSWTRDAGPTFVVDGTGRSAGIAWRFNAWGGKYEPYDTDARLAAGLLDRLGMTRFDAPLVFEGGGFLCDGEGTVVTTESVLLNPNRNPGLTRPDAERLLADWLGARKVIWLPGSMAGDETDGHADNLACFAGPGRLLVQTCSDSGDPNHAPLAENLALLRRERDARGRSLDIVAIDQPVRMTVDGHRLAAAYVNLYVANGGVVMPSFGDPRDDAARHAVEAAFPDRRVVVRPALDIVWGGGGIHCITQQQPAAAFSEA